MRARRLSGAWSGSSWWRRRCAARARVQMRRPLCRHAPCMRHGSRGLPWCACMPLRPHPPLPPSSLQAKTKSFSKEGLNRAALDPKERARAEMRDWLSATVDALNTQVGGRGAAGFVPCVKSPAMRGSVRQPLPCRQEAA